MLVVLGIAAVLLPMAAWAEGEAGGGHLDATAQRRPSHRCRGQWSDGVELTGVCHVPVGARRRSGGDRMARRWQIGGEYRRACSSRNRWVVGMVLKCTPAEEGDYESRAPWCIFRGRGGADPPEGRAGLACKESSSASSTEPFPRQAEGEVDVSAGSVDHGPAVATRMISSREMAMDQRTTSTSDRA